jgi:hypothetical protein
MFFRIIAIFVAVLLLLAGLFGWAMAGASSDERWLAGGIGAIVMVCGLFLFKKQEPPVSITDKRKS